MPLPFLLDCNGIMVARLTPQRARDIPDAWSKIREPDLLANCKMADLDIAVELALSFEEMQRLHRGAQLMTGKSRPSGMKPFHSPLPPFPENRSNQRNPKEPCDPGIKAPGIHRKIWTFLRVITGPHIDDEQLGIRLTICRTCLCREQKNGKEFCMACGCPRYGLAELSTKLRFARLECPLAKFGAIAIQSQETKEK